MAKELTVADLQRRSDVVENVITLLEGAGMVRRVGRKRTPAAPGAAKPGRKPRGTKPESEPAQNGQAASADPFGS